jgi:hypothetical protein
MARREKSQKKFSRPKAGILSPENLQKPPFYFSRPFQQNQYHSV